MASHSYRVEALVQSAHRRNSALIVIEQSALAVSLVLAGSVVILITGTQLLNWYWLALLAVVGAAGVAWRLRGRLPTPYAAAQTLDRRLSLHDSISTAWHLRNDPVLAGTPAGQFQLAQAEQAAMQVDTTAVFPMRISRSWVLPLALAVAAFALFSVRYLVKRNLDFSPSLIPIHLERIAAGIEGGLGLGAHGSHASDEPSSTEQGGKTEQRSAAAQHETAPLNDAPGAKTAAASSEDEKQSAANGTSQASKGPSGAVGNNRDHGNSRPEANSDPSAKESATDAGKDGTKASASQSGSKEQQDSSLMSRMKDAVRSLVAKMKPSEGSTQSSKSNTRNAAAPDQDQTQAETSQSKSESSASKSAQSSAKADSQSKSNEQGQATEMAQSAQSKSSSSAEHRGGNQAKSGIGKQDGGKDLKATEEQQAMGKLAEIIGKRSQQISGEMMVEVPSGKQQLRTDYTGQVAGHTDSGGEINRDEVPLVFQQYVREYMELIHREPPPPAKPADTPH